MMYMGLQSKKKILILFVMISLSYTYICTSQSFLVMYLPTVRLRGIFFIYILNYFFYSAPVYHLGMDSTIVPDMSVILYLVIS